MCNCHSILECCVMFSGVKLSIRLFNLSLLVNKYVIAFRLALRVYRQWSKFQRGFIHLSAEAYANLSSEAYRSSTTECTVKTRI